MKRNVNTGLCLHTAEARAHMCTSMHRHTNISIGTHWHTMPLLQA